MSIDSEVEEVTHQITLSNLIKGFPNYFITLKRIIKNPFNYPKSLAFTDEKEFRKALEFLSYGIAISFVLLIPAAIIHNTKMSKLIYFVRFSLNFIFMAIFNHFSLKVMGARNISLKRTLTMYSYLCGICIPFGNLLLYPILLIGGPNLLFGIGHLSYARVYADLSYYFYVDFTVLILSILLELIGLILFILMIPLMIKWLSISHNISTLRVFCAYLLTSYVGGNIFVFLINPLFNFIFPWIEEILDQL